MASSENAVSSPPAGLSPPGGGGDGGAAGPGSASEKSATAPTSAPKLRSCQTCRLRKVRCDKRSPCSNCRRADIACVFPSTNRPPRWARRLRAGLGEQQPGRPPPPPLPPPGQAVTGVVADPPASATGAIDVGLVLERLRNLESLVRQLTGGALASSGDELQNGGLPGATAVDAVAAVNADRPTSNSTASDPPSSHVHEQFGRMVLDDASRSRYVSSGFWSRVNDELDDLRAETASLANESDDSGDEHWQQSTAHELARTPADRHGFLFGHNLQPRRPDLQEFRPLPSQIPFLFQTYVDNVNCLIQVVYAPTVSEMVRNLTSSNPIELTAGEEALMFAIYYAAITSMEDEDVVKNFATPKADLALQFRLGLEHALAKADFLNMPELILVQAFLIFLFLVRRHDSPRFVWMMTGLVIRMAQAIGLHRDGSNFRDMPPLEAEIRRRIWWALCTLDVRASEDQGTDLTIVDVAFDTKLPLHINDSDIDPASKVLPTAREGLTSMTYAMLTFQMCEVTRRLMTPANRAPALTIEQQSNMLDELYEKSVRLYLQHPSQIDDTVYWVGLTVVRIVVAKMTLILHLPMLFFARDPDVSAEIRARLFACAIEVAEFNEALNLEPRARNWRWAYQTYTHWHAIAYMLVEIPRRPWGPTVERAWVALHSRFLIPPQTDTDTRSMRVWIPLRKLMAQARRHRSAELLRLRADPVAAAKLEADDSPGSPGANVRYVPLSNPSSGELFREQWRRLIAAPQPVVVVSPEASLSSGASNASPPQQLQGISGLPPYRSVSHTSSSPSTLGRSNASSADSGVSGPSATPRLTQTSAPPIPPFTQSGVPVGPVPWLWADADPSVDVFGGVDIGNFDVDMDMEGEVNWQNWFDSVRGLDQATNMGSGGGGREGWQL